MFCKKGALRNFAKFTGKHLRQRLFLIKVAGLRNLESCVIFENTYFYRTSSMAASIKKKTKQQMEITALENES